MSEIFKKMGRGIGKIFEFIAKFIWAIAKVLGMIITFIILFVTISALFSPKLAWVAILIFMLWFVWTSREKIVNLIAALIAIIIAVLIFFNVRQYIFYGIEKIGWKLDKSHFVGGFVSNGKSFGAVKIKNKIIDSFRAYGAADLSDVTIDGELKTYGKLEANNIRVRDGVDVYGHAEISNAGINGDLNVHGGLDLSDSFVLGKTSVYGKIDASNSKFKDLFVYSKNTTLNSCQVKNIYVKNDEKSGDGQEPVLKLVDTKVEGDVVFVGKNGIVSLSRGAVISGKIVGASVQ